MEHQPKAPWLASFGDIPHHLVYHEGSIYDMFRATVRAFPACPAYEFMGRRLCYEDLNQKVLRTARAFQAIGVRPDDRVMLCLPNLPQTVDCFYALSYIGAISVFVHPLSAPGELSHYLSISKCQFVVTPDMFAQKFEDVKVNGSTPQLIVCHISDELSPVKATLYKLAEERKYRLPNGVTVTDWADFMAAGDAAPAVQKAHRKGNDAATVLFTGGSTGAPKGALLSNYNLNALALQTIKAGKADDPGSSMLAIMPMFHGFGLGVGIHAAIGNGGCSILIPRFTPKSYAQILLHQKPNYIAGVPTLYAALLQIPSLKNVDLSYLKGVFSGGDCMTESLRHHVNDFLLSHKCPVRVREGYGMTECVSASCLTPEDMERAGSIGIPYPDTYYMICKSGTDDEVPVGTEGEICICGPTVMLGFLDAPEETARVLHRHSDGNIWLHSGDLGYMDEDGFVYFVQRVQRMIVTSGYNVYPGELEQILEEHPAVRQSCVIGVPDDYRGEMVKAYVSLEKGYAPNEDLHTELMAYCRQNIVAYAVPRELVFEAELPTTLVGKVDFRKLMQRDSAKHKT